MLIKDKDIASYQLLLIKQKRRASLTIESDFFFTFRKKWVGRAMGNETFHWDGLSFQKMYTLLGLALMVCTQFHSERKSQFTFLDTFIKRTSQI